MFKYILNMFNTSEPEVPREVPPVICADCQHYVRRESIDFSDCAASKQSWVDIVTGETITEMRLCRAMRRVGQPCGPEGRLFKPRDAQ